MTTEGKRTVRGIHAAEVALIALGALGVVHAAACGSSGSNNESSMDSGPPVDSSMPSADANGGEDSTAPDASPDAPSDAPSDALSVDAADGAVVAPSCATVLYRAAPSVPVGNSPNWPVLADFDGDKKLDLAVSNSTDDTVSVALGNGDGTFATSKPYAVGTAGGNPGAGYLAVGDFNGDKKLDLVEADYNQAGVTVLLGNGDGTFQAEKVTTAVGNQPWGVVVGDFNFDGKLDVVCTNAGDSDFVTLSGNGDGTFSVLPPLVLGFVPNGVATGDFLGNQRLDLAIAINSGGGGAHGNVGVVAVALLNDAGGFDKSGTYTTDLGPEAVATADFNGDQKLDIVSVNQQGGDYGVLLGNGDGTFGPSSLYPLGGINPHGVVALDANGDLFIDLAAANNGSNDVSLLLNLGDGGFGTATTFGDDAGAGPTGLASGDLNGDGRPDIVVANTGTNNVSVFLDGCQN